ARAARAVGRVGRRAVRQRQRARAEAPARSPAEGAPAGARARGAPARVPRGGERLIFPLSAPSAPGRTAPPPANGSLRRRVPAPRTLASGARGPPHTAGRGDVPKAPSPGACEP